MCQFPNVSTVHANSAVLIVAIRDNINRLPLSMYVPLHKFRSPKSQFVRISMFIFNAIGITHEYLQSLSRNSWNINVYFQYITNPRIPQS